MIVITVARKPLNGTVANNALCHGTGGINIDGCRVASGAFYTEVDYGPRFNANAMGHMGSHQTRPWVQKAIEEGRPVKEAPIPNKAGRWPANLILQHLDGCVCAGTKEVKTGTAYEPQSGSEANHQVYGDRKNLGRTVGFSDPATGTETVPAWTCEDVCPVAEMDRQSGKSISSGGGGFEDLGASTPSGIYGRYGARNRDANVGKGDTGGASRFFKQIQDTEPITPAPEPFIRASGNVPCPVCGRTYLRHPEDPDEPWLNVLCDGTRVKL